MQVDSPFGPKRLDAAANAASTSNLSHAGRPPQQRTAGQDENTKRFAQLKPICIELLGCVGTASRSETHAALYATLQRLSSKLRSFHVVKQSAAVRVPLSLALISYVFFPVAQLLRTLTAPPDRIRCESFRILGELAKDWWQAWTASDAQPDAAADGDASVRQQWKVWQQLLMLAATTLTPRPGQLSEHSEETTLAVLSLLRNILIARTAKVSHVPAEASSSTLDDWEWDGVADLGDMDDYERAMEELEQARLAQLSGKAVPADEIVLVFPSSMHLVESYTNATSRGAMAHALTASLDLARSPARPRQVRVESLRLARVILHVWFAGLDIDLPPDIEQRVEHTVSPEAIKQAQRHTSEFQPAPRAKRLSAFLPGVVSATVRICAEAKVQADVACQAVQLMRLMLTVCLADDTGSRGAGTVHPGEQEAGHDTLESLIAAAHISEAKEVDDLGAEETSPLSVDIPQDDEEALASTVAAYKSKSKAFDGDDTLQRVAVALLSLSPLSAHEHAGVQKAMAELAGDVLLRCFGHFVGVRDGANVDVIRLLFGWLLDLAAREAGKASQLASNYAVRVLIGLPSSTASLISVEIVALAQQMPRLLTSVSSDAPLFTAATRLRYLTRLASGAVDESFTCFDDLRTLLEGQIGYERWAIGVIASISIDEASSSLVGDAATVRLRSLEATTSRAVTDVFVELGAAAGRLCRAQAHTEPLALAEHLMRLAMQWRCATTNASTSTNSLRKRQMSVSALLLAKEVTAGVASVLDDAQIALLSGVNGSRIRKQARRFARSLIAQVVEMWQTDEEELLQGDLVDTAARTQYKLTDEDLHLVHSQTDMPLALAAEYRRGVEERETNSHSAIDVQLGPAVNVDSVQAATISASQLQTSSSATSKPLTRRQRQRQTFTQASRSDALLLAIMSSCGRILGPAVKPLLLQTIYPTVCAVASGSAVVRASAAAALDVIAHAAGYASVQGCLLDHADYVLGAASHRLVSTLGQELEARASGSVEKGDDDDDATSSASVQPYSPLMSALSAPLVLAELIRTLGKEVVVLVEDAIDEVLDAIDRFHGDQAICDGLLSVLDRMLEAILEQSRMPEEEKGEQTEEKGFEPNTQRDFDDFERWYRTRNVDDTVGNEENPFDAGQAPTNGFNDEEDTITTTTTRSQEVTLSMLKKAVPFLSHGSRTLRLRCLRLINRGVEVLCRQRLTAEPLSVVNSLWPMLMSRLGFNLSGTLPDIGGKRTLPRTEDLDERDFYVAIEAVRLLSTLARYLVRYLGREKMLRQAVPRALLLLRIVEHAEERPGEVHEKGGQQTTFLLRDRAAVAAVPSTAVIHAVFRPVRRHSPLAILLEQALVMLDTLVGAMGATMSEADLYALAAHPTLLSCLDTRQYEALQVLARRLYFDTLKKRNAALVWFIVEAATKRADGYPAFLYRPTLSLGTPAMYN